jgi:hypothetical protein
VYIAEKDDAFAVESGWYVGGLNNQLCGFQPMEFEVGVAQKQQGAHRECADNVSGSCFQVHVFGDVYTVIYYRNYTSMVIAA